MQLPVAVAAGHPATAAAGLEILADGGTAADAAVAATLASCVTETIMTGMAGGGHALWWDAERRQAELADFFVTVPGLAGGAAPAMDEVSIPFGSVPVRYHIGAASVGVPGVPAGCDGLWRRWGRLPWPRLCEPALRLAREGAPLPPTHADCLAMLSPVMARNEGAQVYLADGRLLRAGERPRQPGLVALLTALRDEGADTFYRGTVADALISLLAARGSVMTRRDLQAYAVAWAPPAWVGYAGTQVASRRGLCTVLDALARLPAPAGRTPVERALALTRALGGQAEREPALGHTTNLVATDAAGNACVVTTSLGLGSADWLPDFGLHLNSMLGEVDLQRGALRPGQRMGSMMAPTVAVDDAGLVLAGGSAGGSRIASALVQVLAGVLDEGLAAAEAVQRPRLHPVGMLLHVEAGYPAEALAALQAAGHELTLWPGRHHYFGGVSVVSRRGAAGDPRRDGAAARLA